MRCGPGHTGCFISKCKTTTIKHKQNLRQGCRTKMCVCVCVMHFFNGKKYTIYGKNTNIEEKSQRLRPKGMWWRWNGVALWRPVKIGEPGKIVLKTIPALKDWTSHSRRFKCQTLDSQGGTELQYCNCHGSGCNENWDTAGSSGGSSAGGIRPMEMIFLALVGILPIMSTLSQWIGERQIGFKVWYTTLPLQCQLLLAFCTIHFFRFTFIFGILLWMFVEINDLECVKTCLF